MTNISTRIFHPNARSLFYIWNQQGLFLGQKKEGLAKGLWLGPGGKSEVGESPLSNIPYELMWEDDRHWLPHVLAGKFVIGKFTFNDQDRIIRQEIHTFPLPKRI